MQHRTAPVITSPTGPDLIVWSHLRWDFVFQRPQQLMSRFAKQRRIFFFEEPIFTNTFFPKLNFSIRDHGVIVATPELRRGTPDIQVQNELKTLVDEMIEDEEIHSFTSWYYTPMALQFTEHLTPAVVIYDAMDELSAFKNAPPLLTYYEQHLIEKADLVFTGGQSLYEAKRHRHPNVYCYPSSIDAAHFGLAREKIPQPADQVQISGPSPRLGFFGVIDERFNLSLLKETAALRPDWQFVIIGPVVKIDPQTLPQASNIHYLGMKQYSELPNYLSGWDVAMLPFAKNDSTRFISPTKTPEYLAAGCPVVSTSIKDVVSPYGELSLVEIADTPEEFIKAAEQAMMRKTEDPAAWFKKVDAFLSGKSWDQTVKSMLAVENKIRNHSRASHYGLKHNLFPSQPARANELEA